MDLALHPTRFPASLEKWYVDALLDDGSVLLVYLGALTLWGARLARLTAEFFPAEGPTARGSASVYHIHGAANTLQFGAATIDGVRLRFTTNGLSGELEYYPRAPSLSLREPFLTEGGRSLHWSVEIPDSDVTGHLAWPGGERSLVGRGYRDRVWFDFPPWRFPISELVWGRAAAGTHAATWVRAITSRGIVAASYLDGRNVAPGAASDPPEGVSLGSDVMFVDADVAALDTLRLAALRGPIRKLSGDPHETKWRAPCVIAGQRGVAVHEVVRWPSLSH